mmetsp:Transcript_1902/g.5685  ORF Transcript_1902/g.5685 Transcript_1902/m.5685 type:complete len:295 (+) Transcript_1902:1299-2183(+)
MRRSCSTLQWPWMPQWWCSATVPTQGKARWQAESARLARRATSGRTASGGARRVQRARTRTAPAQMSAGLAQRARWRPRAACLVARLARVGGMRRRTDWPRVRSVRRGHTRPARPPWVAWAAKRAPTSPARRSPAACRARRALHRGWSPWTAAGCCWRKNRRASRRWSAPSAPCSRCRRRCCLRRMTRSLSTRSTTTRQTTSPGTTKLSPSSTPWWAPCSAWCAWSCTFCFAAAAAQRRERVRRRSSRSMIASRPGISCPRMSSCRCRSGGSRLVASSTLRMCYRWRWSRCCSS